MSYNPDLTLEGSIVAGGKTKRSEVFRFIVTKGPTGATDEEIELGTGMPHQTASARRNELAGRGLVYPAGNRRRATKSGKLATVWLATLKGTEPALEHADGHEEREMQDRVLEFMRAQKMGATDEEIAKRLRLKPAAAIAARLALITRGLVAPTGKTRGDSIGRRVVVWAAFAPSEVQS